MQTNLILASGAVAALLWVSPALARPTLSPETRCENGKLHAAGAYAECLARAASAANAIGGELDDAAVGRCNDRFDRVFEWAEANGACRTAGGPATLRGPIRGQIEETLATVKSGPGCPRPLSSNINAYTCLLTSSSAVDLAAIVTQINNPQVTDDTVVWIEAWGANGGRGNTDNGGNGGAGGYAQTTTTVNRLREFFGTSEIYYYLGREGWGPSADAGGDGGTGTIVTANDLTREEASFGNTVILAGGGGGGGAGRGASVCLSKQVYGATGGAGGQAISTLGAPAFGVGAKGGERRNQNYSGSGGGGDFAGSGGAVNGKGSAGVGDDGMAALGGRGGNRAKAEVGFYNQSGVQMTRSGGHGGEPGYAAGGGGGGGGYGGGGGGAQGIGATDCVAGGGGGGGSMARASTVDCARSRPSRPDITGFKTRGVVQIVFDRRQCS